jgi:SAM-dependent methyltransferase
MTDYNAAGFADRFRSSRPLDPATQKRWAELLRKALPDATVVDTALDLGAGTGRFWPVLRQAWHPRHIVAVDSSAAMLGAAVPATDVEAVVTDIDNDAIAQFRAEAVFCSMSLHYSADPERVCGRLRAMLPPGGLLCVRTASSETIAANVVLGFFPTAARAELAAFPGRAVIERWLAGSGFLVRSEVVYTPAAPGHVQLFCRALGRGLPSLQLVSKPEFVLGMLRLGLWAAAGLVRRRPVAMDQTLLVTGVAM